MAGERGARPPVVNVLMYHSIAVGPGPTSIAPAVFEAQMQVLDRSGCTVVPLTAVADWMAGTASIPDRAVAITFDDGFADFLPAARILSRHGYTSTMFLPTGRVGGVEQWAGAAVPPRAMMRWSDAAALATEGVSFGGHTVTHPDLTTLAPDVLEKEVRTCREDIERNLGVVPTSFAAPYGASNATVCSVVGRHFAVAVGTELGRPALGDDVLNIPRIEMFYFRDGARFSAFLDGRAEWYFRARQAARAIGRRLRPVMPSR